MTGGTSLTSKCSSLSLSVTSSDLEGSAGLALSADLSGLAAAGSFLVLSLLLCAAACFALSGVAFGDCCCAGTNGIVKIAKSKTVRTFMPVSEEKSWEKHHSRRLARCQRIGRDTSVLFCRVSASENGGLFAALTLRPIGAAHTVGRKDIRQGYDAQQFVHIGSAHYRQDFNLVCAHAFERQIKPLIGVYVRKNERVDQVTEFLVGAFGEFFVQLCNGDHADDSAGIHHQPRSKLSGGGAFQCLAHREFGRQ